MKPQEVPTLPLAGPDVEISGPAIWPEQCSLHIHKIHEANIALARCDSDYLDDMLLVAKVPRKPAFT